MQGKSLSVRVFYGWFVAAAVGATAFIAWGVGFYQLGVFVDALHDQRGWSLATLSVGPTIFYLLVGLTSLIAGRIIDRIGPRIVLLAGSLILGAGMVTLGQVRSVWQFYLADAVLAIGFTCTSTLVLGAVVGRWFHRRRAAVMTYALSGAPLGALVLVPARRLLLDRYSLATSGAVLAGLSVAVVVPLAAFVIRDPPVAYGGEPNGNAQGPQQPPSTETKLWTVREAVHTRTWQLLTFAFVAIMLGQVAYLVYQVSFLSSVIGDGQAAVLVSVTGAFGVLGRFAGGLGDRVSRHLLMGGYCLIQGIAVMLAVVSTHPVLLGLSAALVGLTMGNTVALQPVLMAEHFGMRSYGAVFGTSSFLTQWGAAAGLSFVGVLADQTGSYVVPFTITGMLALLAGGAAVAAGRQPRSVAGVVASPGYTHSSIRSVHRK